jgi:RNA polymerase sigma-70 factor (ECF subfamily)
MDRKLVERAQGGDRAAFAAIASASLSGMDRVARLITRDPERAKDAVQETLIKAWRDLPGLRDASRFDAWLRQLLVRSCMDELRRGRRISMEVELIETHHPMTADAAVSVADRDALERGFRRLDPEQRALVVLHYYQGLPLDEAAAALRVPVGTAKSRLFRAREALRAALEADARMLPTMTQGRVS